MASDRPIGILSAMPQEVAKLREHVTDQQEHKIGACFQFTTGTLEGKPVVFGYSNIGMVFAASAVRAATRPRSGRLAAKRELWPLRQATMLCQHFNVRCVLFTGVAGGLKDGQQIGDLVVGEDVVNYEFDCTGFVLPGKTHELGEIPFVGWRFYEADPAMLQLALDWVPPDGTRVSKGRLASGSIFITSGAKAKFNESQGPALGFPVAAEMENAGVAQICKAFGTPYLSLRALSDLLTGDANADFNEFCQQAADKTFPLISHIVSAV